MTIRLEAGKRYRDREGNETAPLVPNGGYAPQRFPFSDPVSGRTYAPDGCYYSAGGSRCDLIAEVPDAPAPEALPVNAGGSAKVWPDGGLGCFDCGRRYGDAHGFPDLLVPDEVWRCISPTGGDGGLLCPSCICARVEARGIKSRAEWRSGPFSDAPAPAPEGWRVKPLEWRGPIYGFWEADTIGGVIKVMWDYSPRDGNRFILHPLTDDRQAFPTEAEAKAAAQADHEARIRACLEPAAPPPSAPEGWRDMASAPKDGTDFLGWTGTEALVAYYHDGDWAWCKDRFGAIGYTSRLTHWMPLPTPPAAPPPPPVEREVVHQMDGNRPLPWGRDTLGRMVREAWVRWAQTQPNPKPSWLAPYDDLSEPDKEADRQIGETIARWTLIGDAARASFANDPAPPPPPVEREVVVRGRFSPVLNFSDGGRSTATPTASPPAGPRAR